MHFTWLMGDIHLARYYVCIDEKAHAKYVLLFLNWTSDQVLAGTQPEIFTVGVLTVSRQK